MAWCLVTNINLRYKDSFVPAWQCAGAGEWESADRPAVCSACSLGHNKSRSPVAKASSVGREREFRIGCFLTRKSLGDLLIHIFLFQFFNFCQTFADYLKKVLFAIYSFWKTYDLCTSPVNQIVSLLFMHIFVYAFMILSTSLLPSWI
jgi:hypothetical protein